MTRTHMEALIRKHEGCEYISYNDTEGKRTIAIGFNLDKEGARTRIEALGLNYDSVYEGTHVLTYEHCNALLKVDLDDAIDNARVLVSNFDEQPEDVQSVIVDMIYNLGPSGFSKFVKTIAALVAKDYCTAVAEMSVSKWARQVPNRAKDDIDIVEAHCQPRKAWI
jgi:lysozyme